MHYNLAFNCSCFRQLATSALVDVNGIFYFKFLRVQCPLTDAHWNASYSISHLIDYVVGTLNSSWFVLCLDDRPWYGSDLWSLITFLSTQCTMPNAYNIQLDMQKGNIYTLNLKKCNFSELAFVLEKIVVQWSCAKFSFPWPWATDPNPGSPGKLESARLQFFWGRVYSYLGQSNFGNKPTQYAYDY